MPVNPAPLQGALPTLLPIRFPDGFVIDQMSDECAACHEEIPMDGWMAEGNWLGQNVLVLHLGATCGACRSDQKRHLRIRGMADGTGQIETQAAEGGWVNYEAHSTPWWHRLALSARKVLGLAH